MAPVAWSSLSLRAKLTLWFLLVFGAIQATLTATAVLLRERVNDQYFDAQLQRWERAIVRRRRGCRRSGCGLAAARSGDDGRDSGDRSHTPAADGVSTGAARSRRRILSRKRRARSISPSSRKTGYVEIMM